MAIPVHTIPLLLLLLLPLYSMAAGTDAQQQRLWREIQEMTAESSAETGVAHISEEVIGAMSRVPRDRFLPEKYRDRAWENRPFPIGHGQTISQPFIVALMTELLGVGPGDRVLEIGTGSGYQAAVLAELGCRVWTMEIIEPLGREATRRLERLGYGDRVRVRIGDGYYGWPEAAPFDGIIVTAASSQIPPPLIEQLKPGGRMVIPVGSPWLTQYLVLVEKNEAGQVFTRQLLPVRFVPFTRK